MSETIQILDAEHEYCTAKEAMQFAVEYMQSNAVHAIQKITCRHGIAPDSEAELFVKMFGRFLHKNHCKVFLFAETEKLLAGMIEVLPEKYTGIRIVSVATMEEAGISDDMILNRINGDEVDCIIASFSEEMQDRLFQQYRNSLDVKIWVELGTKLRTRRKIAVLKPVQEFFHRLLGRKKEK